jgi:integrase
MTSVRAVPGEERLDVKALGDLYLAHLQHVRGRKPTTLEDYRSMLRRHLVPYFGGTKVDRLRAVDIDAFVMAKRRESLAPKTVRNLLIFLNGLLSFGVRRGALASNPAADVDRPPAASDSPIRHLDRAELRAVLAAVPGDQWAHLDHALYLTAALTGLRQGELLALRWADVDFAARVIRVRRTYTRGRWSTPKSARAIRAVPLAEQVRRELRRHRDISPYDADTNLVFAHPERGTVLDASRLRRRFKNAVRGAGLEHVRFHDLRHTYGTALAAAGTPMRMLQEWMGHRSHTTTLIYAAYAPDASHGLAFVDRAFGDPSDA